MSRKSLCVTTLLCATVLPGLAVAPLAAATFCVNPGGTDGCFSSIGAAVTAADATLETDTINVAAGTYAESVVIPVTEDGLTINGPNAGIDPCTGNRGAEAIVGTGELAFLVNRGADDTTIDGFTIQGGSIAGIIASQFANDVESSGTHVLHNIVQNNAIGIVINGTDVLIRANDIRNNNNVPLPFQLSGIGVYADNGLSSSTIDANCFTGHQTQATLLVQTVIAASPPFIAEIRDVTLSNNRATADSGFAFLHGSDLRVTGNANIDNSIASSYFFDTVSGAVVDGNLALNGAFSGIRVDAAAESDATSSGISASCNRLVGNAAGIDVGAGTHAGTLQAENNWFGCNEGPGNAGCDAVIGDVDFDPWLVLTVDVNPAPVQSGAASTLVASLSSNSDGAVAPCTVPDGTPVAFSSTCGSVDPAFTATGGGEASAILTGGPIGSCEVSAAVDDEVVAQQVEVTGFAAIPTASTIGLTILGLGLAAFALSMLRR